MKTATTILMGLLVVGLVAAGVSAFGWNAEGRDAIKTAVENNDYDAWATAMQAQITEENFQEHVERYENRGGEGKKGMHGKGRMHDEMAEAIEAGDYGAWKELVGDRHPATEEDFAKMQDIHAAMQAGEYEQAKAMHAELGFTCPGKRW